MLENDSILTEVTVKTHMNLYINLRRASFYISLCRAKQFLIHSSVMKRRKM